MIVSVDTNINTARFVVLDGAKFQITRINATNIGAALGNVGLEVFYGDVMQQIRVMNVSQLAHSLGIQNTDIACSRTSKGFLMVIDGNSIFGNCIN